MLHPQDEKNRFLAKILCHYDIIRNTFDGHLENDTKAPGLSSSDCNGSKSRLMVARFSWLAEELDLADLEAALSHCSNSAPDLDGLK
jgi:hypothetical protein